jgi:hypothetical protein
VRAPGTHFVVMLQSRFECLFSITLLPIHSESESCSDLASSACSQCPYKQAMLQRVLRIALKDDANLRKERTRSNSFTQFLWPETALGADQIKRKDSNLGRAVQVSTLLGTGWVDCGYNNGSR